jgi:branched-subunit amino acid aminotransferase/4-amino-4-deoxychorismate lyase
MELGDPRAAVWTGVAWNGGELLLNPALHLARLRRHAPRLGIALPEDLVQQLSAALAILERPADPLRVEGQAPYLIRAGVLADGSLSLKPSVPIQWPTEPLIAVSESATTEWPPGVAGTKHGHWTPYVAARNAAKARGAHVALLFGRDADGDEFLCDGDRCAPLVLGADGSCCYPLHEEGALDSVTLEALKPALEAAGFRVCGRRIRRSELIAASEVLVIGSGMGVRAIGSLDGVALGSSAAAPRSPRPLHRAAWAAWLDALKHGWTRPDT